MQQDLTLKSKDGQFLVVLKEPLTKEERRAIQFLIDKDPAALRGFLLKAGFNPVEMPSPLTEKQIIASLQ
jgi:hypothetical protein